MSSVDVELVTSSVVGLQLTEIPEEGAIGPLGRISVTKIFVITTLTVYGKNVPSKFTFSANVVPTGTLRGAEPVTNILKSTTSTVRADFEIICPDIAVMFTTYEPKIVELSRTLALLVPSAGMFS